MGFMDEPEKILRILDNENHTFLIPIDHILSDQEVIVTKACQQTGVYIFQQLQWERALEGFMKLENVQSLRRMFLGSAIEYSICHGVLNLPDTLYLYGGFEKSNGLARLIPSKALGADCFLLCPVL